MLEKITEQNKGQVLSNEQILNTAHYFRQMGDYDESIKYFNKLLGSEGNVQALLGLAECYQDQGDFIQAIKMIEKIKDWEKYCQTLLIIAHCYKAKHKMVLAIYFFNEIIKINQVVDQFNLDMNNMALVGIAQCYEDEAKYSLAFETYSRISVAHKDIFTIISLARCYKKLGSSVNALKTYESLVDSFPEDQYAWFSYCEYLIELDHIDSYNLLKELLKEWPSYIQLNHLYAQYLSQKKDFKMASESLKVTINNFPYYKNSYVALIRNYLMMGDIESAEAVQKQCSIEFKGDYKLSKSIEKMMKTKRLIKYLGENCLSEEKIQKKIDLPAVVKNTFNRLTPLSNECYLVGNSLHYLLKNEPFKITQSISFFLAVKNIESLKDEGFIKSRNNSKLYTGIRNGFLIKCYIFSENDALFQSNNLLPQQFTKDLLYCDNQGNIIDPSGMGIHDFKLGIIRTVVSYETHFRKAPNRLLDVIQELAVGFKSTTDINEMMLNWLPEYDKNKPYLYTVLQGYLASPSPDRYFQLLQHYGLLKNLLELPPINSLESLKIKLSELTNPLTNRVGFFENKEENKPEVLNVILQPR